MNILQRILHQLQREKRRRQQRREQPQPVPVTVPVSAVPVNGGACGDVEYYRPGESPDAEETYVIDANGRPSGKLRTE